jgi:hypothetical protein
MTQWIRHLATSLLKSSNDKYPLDWWIYIEILKWTCTMQWRCSYLLRHEGQILDNFKKFKVIKIVLDSMFRHHGYFSPEIL